MAPENRHPQRRLPRPSSASYNVLEADLQGIERLMSMQLHLLRSVRRQLASLRQLVGGPGQRDKATKRRTPPK
ncbi:MAG: hypothetical protein KDA58_09390 [Planctomycetaceae bacterium]|nr:hypothetical protein [Planctomycetaceae bacterium]